MKWVAISGSWRTTSQEVEYQVRQTVHEILGRGDGIITGGALGVDYFALDEGLRCNPSADKVKVFIPTPLKLYVQHLRHRASERVVTKTQAESLIAQLRKLKSIRGTSCVENLDSTVVNKETYYERNSAIIEAADELVAFQVNVSEGTQDVIQKAREKGIPVKVYSYSYTT